MKTVLITGGAGFIGSNLVEWLFSRYPDYQIFVLDSLTYAGRLENIPDEIKASPRFGFWHGNVCHSEIVHSLVERADVVVHLAAESHVARSIYDNRVFFETDVLGTQTVANAVLRYQHTLERFIHVSSSEVYGSAVVAPMREDHPLNPTSPYAGAKAGADRLVSAYHLTYDIPAVIVRPFNTYGPRQHLEKVIPRFITRALRDKPLTIHGDGTNTRDWMYVEDLCAALDRAMHADLSRIRGEAINVGTGREISVAEIAQTIVDRLEKPRSLIEYTGDRMGSLLRHCAATAKASQLLGWAAHTAFDRGVERTIDWYAAHRDWWEGQVWMETVAVRTRDGSIVFY